MDLGGFSMFDLFRTEVQQHCAALADGLVALEQRASDPKMVEPLMRAAHSIKGAARIINLDGAVQLAHAMEECLVRIQRATEVPVPSRIDDLLKGSDVLLSLADRTSEADARAWLEKEATQIAALSESLNSPPRAGLGSSAGARPVAPTPAEQLAEQSVGHAVGQTATMASALATPPTSPVASLPSTAASPSIGSGVLVAASSLERLLQLSGESLVEARRLESIRKTLTRAKRAQRTLADALDSLEVSGPRAGDAMDAVALSHHALDEALTQVEDHLRRGEELASALHNEAVASRMRPFGDACGGFSRSVRDVARALGKEVKLVISGEQVPVDREILRQLEAPLGHLVRNAIDHGIESPADRVASGKPSQATLSVEARHHAGSLLVEVREDGRGINREGLRGRIVAKNLSTAELAATMDDAELFDFLFLPGFSTAAHVTDISGRGVGLDVVRSMAHAVGGSVEVRSSPRGTSFVLRLPVTLSVVRAAVVSIAGETYALALARLDRIDRIARTEVTTIEGRPTAVIKGDTVGLVHAWELLELKTPQNAPHSEDLAIVSLHGGGRSVGLIVDSFLGEEDLVIRRLDARLGQVPHVDSASIRENGDLLLVLDADDLVQSTVQLLERGQLRGDSRRSSASGRAQKRILVVEDSITVREVERQMLLRAGYLVDTAVDGVDGWNALQKTHYDLIVSDVDMPRMNGIELVSKIRGDRRFEAIPVVIVSYKDREEDRLAGMDAGASAYLTKGSFQDQSFLRTIADLVGSAP
ncbi:MAG: hybrid sensor histidine kinase/response regulator [Phycisphaerales bacterium]|nr:hybrid sensor histidine kinase/response regulator [Phycisphaerales bacterium]